MTAAGLNHVSVAARDLDESTRFYERLFGVEIVPSPNFGFPVRWLRLGDQQLHLFQQPGDVVPPNAHFSVTVDDIEPVYRAAQELGAFSPQNFDHHFYALPNDCLQLYLRDPNGNLVEVNALGADRLSDEVRKDVKVLAELAPQSDENLSATLFLDR